MDAKKKEITSCGQIKSALQSSLSFIENETEKATTFVEKGVETVLLPFEKLIEFIRHECELLEKSKLIIQEACDLISKSGDFIHGEPNFGGFISLLFWLQFCYIFEVWMLPLIVPLIFLRQYILIYFRYLLIELDEEYLGSEKKEDEKSITEMLQELCDVCDNIDTGIETTASIIKTTKRTLNFREPEICYLAILISTGAAVILYHIPLRYFIIFGSIYLFSKNYLKVNGYMNNDND